MNSCAGDHNATTTTNRSRIRDFCLGKNSRLIYLCTALYDEGMYLSVKAYPSRYNLINFQIIFGQIIYLSSASSVDPDLVPHCLTISHLWDTRYFNGIRYFCLTIFRPAIPFGVLCKQCMPCSGAA